MLPPISRSPNDPNAPANDGPVSPSRVTRGAPAAPLRSVPRRDPADESTLSMLGSNPLNDPNGHLGGAATGGAGLGLASMSMIAKGLQGLNTVLPGFVPAEVLMWVTNAMQQLPAALQQQAAGVSAPPPAGTPPPPTTPGALGPSAQPMAPGPSMGGGAVGMGAMQ